MKMVELKVNDEIHFINPNKICFVSLGDGSLPAEQALARTCREVQGGEMNERLEKYKFRRQLRKIDWESVIKAIKQQTVK